MKLYFLVPVKRAPAVIFSTVLLFFFFLTTCSGITRPFIGKRGCKICVIAHINYCSMMEIMNYFQERFMSKYIFCVETDRFLI